MKVMCISDNYIYKITTIGKVYHVYETIKWKAPRFIDDEGNERSYRAFIDFFITMDEYRNNKLEQLGL